MKMKAENIRLVAENIKLSRLVNEFMGLIIQNPELRAEIERINAASKLPVAERVDGEPNEASKSLPNQPV
jgi:hypothetical protein